MDFAKHAIILEVINRLHEHGSWTGKTHVQKALSLLRDKGVVQVPFRFVLYRHGPYSFDVEAELEQMRSYGAIEEEPNEDGYGIVISAGEMAGFVRRAHELDAGTCQAIDDVCEFVGSRNIFELERLATASWIRNQERVIDSSQLASRLHRLKPHISEAEAIQSDRVASQWISNPVRVG